jgi:O-antigen/teichoic acid export membrane protein
MPILDDALSRNASLAVWDHSDATMTIGDESVGVQHELGLPPSDPAAPRHLPKRYGSLAADPSTALPGPASLRKPADSGRQSDSVRSRNNYVVNRNFVWLLVSQLATWCISGIILIVAPRILGGTQFGELTFAMAYVSFFQLVALLGTNTFIVKTVARDHDLVGIYVVNAVVLKICLTTVLAFVAISAARVLGYSGDTMTVIVIVSVSMVIVALNDTLQAAFQGLEQMVRPAIWAVVQEYVGTGLGILALVTHRGIVGYATAICMSGLVSLVPNSLRLWPAIRSHLRVDFAVLKKVLVGGLPFLSWAVILLVYGSIDIVLLEAITNSATVGWYALAYQLVGLPAFFSSVVVTAVLPSLSEKFSRHDSDFGSLANRALRLVVFVGAPTAAGIAIIASPLITLLYPAEFQHSVPLTQILALHIPIVGVDMVLGTTLIACDRQRQWLIVGAIAAVVNPLLNLVAIPASVRAFSNGAIGAAIVTVGTEVLMMIGAILLRPAGVLDGATSRYMIRASVAAATILPTVFLARGLPLVGQILVGVGAYAAASFLMRTVSLPEVRGWLQQALNAARRSKHSAVPRDSELVA